MCTGSLHAVQSKVAEGPKQWSWASHINGLSCWGNWPTAVHFLHLCHIAESTFKTCYNMSCFFPPNSVLAQNIICKHYLSFWNGSFLFNMLGKTYITQIRVCRLWPGASFIKGVCAQKNYYTLCGPVFPQRLVFIHLEFEVHLHINLRPCVGTTSNGRSTVLQAKIVILGEIEVFDAQEW
jgi:hypothetical protein